MVPNWSGATIAVYVCVCNGVTEREIRDVSAAGCGSVAELTMRTGCGASCGSCLDMAQALIDEAHASKAHAAGETIALPTLPVLSHAA